MSYDSSDYQCLECPGGFRCDGTEKATLCLPDQYCEAGKAPVANCQSCSLPGSYDSNGASVCQDVNRANAAHFFSYFGLDCPLVECPDGSRRLADGTCELVCPAGKYYDGQGACKGCPDGK